MTITYHRDLMQGSEEWRAVRCGMLTASEMKLIITPTLKTASNEKERAHLYELLAQRITGYVEPVYISDDMLRGQVDEMEARLLYIKHYAPVDDVGFITNDQFGFMIGCSPDGLVGDDGMLETKSRRQKFQIETIINGVDGIIPADFVIQVQTQLMVAEREWCDLVSYSGGLPMVTIRVYPDRKVQDAIAYAAMMFEERLSEKLDAYRDALKIVPALKTVRAIPTERKIIQEMFVR